MTMQLVRGKDDMLRGAELSDDGMYRYRLARRWGLTPRPVVWVMLNPSTADGILDDPTIRRCVGFTRAWGFDAITVVNLYAYRASKPAAMWLARMAGHDIIGPDNEEHLAGVMAYSAHVVAAWGANAEPERARQVATLAAQVTGEPLACLGVTKDGQPRHPLYVAGSTVLTPWE